MSLTLIALDSERWFGWLGPTGAVLLAALLVLFCLIAWSLNLIGLPGNWLSVAVMALYAWLGPESGRLAIGLTALITAFVFALLGELVEFLAGAVGAQRAGASRKSTIYAMIGSIAGAVLGAVVGIPVPVVGPILAAILFGGAGATAGAVYGEWTDGRCWRESWVIGQAAFWGRTFGTLGKFAAGFVVFLCSLAGVVF